MEKNTIHVNGGITINVNVKCKMSVKNVMYAKKFMFRILLHVIAKMENI